MAPVEHQPRPSSRRAAKYSVRSSIRRHISEIPDNTLFSTRELLHYGRRSSVDTVLHTMVKNELIVRVARGLFMRLNENLEVPSIFDIAKKKAQAFFKEICEHGVCAAQRLKLIEPGKKKVVFYTNGRSSSFRVHTLDMRIYFHGTTPKRMQHPSNKIGEAIRGIWYLGKEQFEPSTLALATRQFFKRDRKLLYRSAAMMPTWIWNPIISGFNKLSWGKKSRFSALSRADKLPNPDMYQEKNWHMYFP